MLPPRDLIRFESMTLDVAGRSLFDASGTEVQLTRSEYELLATLLRLSGRALSREYLLDAVAGRRAEPYDRSIDMLIGRLRRKIESDPKAPRLIVAVPGVGYKFTATPRRFAIPAEQRTNPGFHEAARDLPAQLPPHEAESSERPDDLIALALACKSAGRPGQALELLAEAAQRAPARAMHAIHSDLHRLRADVLADLGDYPAAEANLLEALGLARQHHAGGAELRAATGLARLWRDQGRREEAHDLLAPVYARLGTDSHSLDARAASVLLQDLIETSRTSSPTH